MAGRPTYFVRVGGCDFKCLWCDSDHAVNVDKVRALPRATAIEIYDDLDRLADAHPGPDWVTISGGNPALYDLAYLVEAWHNRRSNSGNPHMVAVETQGSRYAGWFDAVNLLTVSPKPPSSGMRNNDLENFMGHAGLAEDRLSGWNWKMVFKVVVFDEEDYSFARSLHRRYPLIPFYLSCGTAMGGLSGKWVPPPIPGTGPDDFDRFRSTRANPEFVEMPNGEKLRWSPSSYVDTNETLLARYRWLAERMMNDSAMSDVAGFPQLHALTWGIETRGV